MSDEIVQINTIIINKETIRNINRNKTASQTIKSTQTKKAYSSNIEINFRDFIAHIPSWGGIINTLEADFENET